MDPDPVLPAIEAAAAAGIPVLTIDRAMDGATSYIGTDNVAGSRMAGEYLFEAMGGSGTVIEIEGDPAWAQGRTEGFGQALEAAPGITLVGQETAWDDPNMARLLTANFLGAYPDVSGIFVHTDGMTPGVLSAVAEAGLTDTVRVVSFDGAPDDAPSRQGRDPGRHGRAAARPDGPDGRRGRHPGRLGRDPGGVHPGRDDARDAGERRRVPGRLGGPG